MSILAKRRRISAIAAADDAELFSAVAALSIEAFEEVYERHAAALCGLALLVAENSRLAEDAVAGTFIALWRSPASICLDEQSLRAALAGEVYARCKQMQQTHAAGQVTKTSRDPPPTPADPDPTLLPHFRRDLLALIMLGEHSCREAAHRVGLDEAAATRMITSTLRVMHDVKRKPHACATGFTGRAQVPWRSH
jgi:DNA-directed RNA polymerase specialized sigma24 family protein